MHESFCKFFQYKVLKVIKDACLSIWSFRPSRVQLVAFLILFFLPALIFTIWLFGSPWKKISIELQVNEEYYLYENIENSLAKYFLSSLFQTTLGLDAYNVVFINQRLISTDGITRTHEVLLVDEEGGALEVTILEKEKNTIRKLYTQVGQKTKEIIKVGDKPVIVIKEIVSRRPSAVPSYLDSAGNDVCPTVTEIDIGSTQLYFENNLGAWIVKLLTILILWSAGILYFKKLLNFFDKE